MFWGFFFHPGAKIMLSREKINTYCLYVLKRKFNPKNCTWSVFHLYSNLSQCRDGPVLLRLGSQEKTTFLPHGTAHRHLPFRFKVFFPSFKSRLHPLFTERQECQWKKTTSSRHHLSLLPLCRRHRRVLIMNPTVSICTLKHAARLIPGLTYGCGDVSVR